MIEKNRAILAFDCSTAEGSVALRRHGATLASAELRDGSQAQTLLPAIADLMARAGLGWDAIGLIAVTVGPGRFTGMRIGLAAARGLALARRLPIAGVSTAALLAWQVRPEALAGRRLLVAIDSRRDDLFVQPFGADRQPLDQIRAMTAPQAAAHYGGPLLVVGDAAPAFAGLRSELWPTPSRPRADALAELAVLQWQSGRSLPPEPLYLRPPDVTVPV